MSFEIQLQLYIFTAMKLILVLVFLVLTHCCFAQGDAATPMLDFSKNNYTLQYPGSWRLDTSGQFGTELLIFSPLESESDKFSENVNVMVQNLQGQNVDLAKYKQRSDQEIADLATDGKIFESSILKNDKGEFFKIVYAMSQGKFRLKITSVCFIRNDKAYLATFTSEFDKYDNYKNTAEQILTSFRLTK